MGVGDVGEGVCVCGGGGGGTAWGVYSHMHADNAALDTQTGRAPLRQKVLHADVCRGSNLHSQYSAAAWCIYRHVDIQACRLKEGLRLSQTQASFV